MAETPETSQGQTSVSIIQTTVRKRHGCLTDYLIFMIVVLLPSVLLYLFFPDIIARSNPEIPGWISPFFGLVGITQITCILAIWRWKKWGFYVFLVLGLGFGCFNAWLTGSVITFLMAPIGILIMYGVLHIGGPQRKGWTQLE